MESLFEFRCRCGRRYKAQSTLTRHVRSCDVARADYLSHQRPDVHVRTPSPTGGSIHTLPHTPYGNLYNDGSTTVEEDVYMPTGNWGYHDADGLLHDGEASPNSPTLEPYEEAFVGSSTTGTTFMTVTQTFEDVEGRPAGMPVYTSPRHVDRDDNPFWPFVTEFDFAFASWLNKVHCTKGDVDLLFTDSRLAPLFNMLQFSSADQWHALIDTIPYGIPGNTWKKTALSVPTPDLDGRTTGVDDYELLHQDIVDIITFQLAYPPFKDYLKYAPERLFQLKKSRTGDEQLVRMYTALDNSDWWWDTQQKLPEGATVVPIMIGVDKTHLTNYQGDQIAWPVYVSVGNLSAGLRRSRKVPGNILAGLLPVVKHPDPLLKAHVYHMSMAKLLDPIRSLGRDGIQLYCADGASRLCFPIICGIMADYAEQVLITGVKDRQHCTICKVPPSKRTVLVEPGRPDKTSAEYWQLRTHEDTQRTIAEQHRTRLNKSHPDFVHPVQNFAWDFPHVNIHKALMPDLLHQLYKGIIMHSLDWLSSLLSTLYGNPNRKYATSGQHRLDQRYREVPHFPGLKLFNNTPVSRITQWTGTEQRAVMRQVLAVYVPLLKQRPDALRYLRAICDFVMLSEYHSHDEETLEYMLDALERIDAYKWELQEYRPSDADGTPQFNIPKFHAISHYIWSIRQYGPLPNVDPGQYTEAPHMYLVKVFFSMTNKKQALYQICAHNTRMLRMQSLEGQLRYNSRITFHRRTDLLEARTLHVSAAVPLHRVGLAQPNPDVIKSLGQSPTYWILLKDLMEDNNLSTIRAPLAAFLREELNANQAGLVRSSRDAELLESNPVWVDRYLLSIHPSIRYWKTTGRFDIDPVGEETEFIRCVPNWHNSGHWLRHYVWVQEYSPSQDDPLRGQRLGQVQLIFTVIDPAAASSDDEKLKHTCVLLRMLKPVNAGRPHPVHGMIVMRSWPAASRADMGRIGADRCFSVRQVLRSAHAVPSGEPGEYTINNFIDFSEYNSLYSEDWLVNNREHMRQYNRKRKRGVGQSGASSKP